MFGRLAASVILIAGMAAAPLRAEESPEPTRSCAALVSSLGPDRICIGQKTYFTDVCSAIGRLAREYRLPEGYLARLIWQESRFDPSAVSPAGAQGIAQFMPGTARLRGLGNAFSPADALARSADYLRFLVDKFGNLGLAAAAYNGGEARVSGWQNGGWLAGETRNYVMIITGVPAESWLEGNVDDPDFSLQPDKPFDEACIEMANTRPMPRLALPSGTWKPWGVLIAQAFSPKVAMTMFERQKKRFPKLFGNDPPLALGVKNPNFGNRLRHSVQLGRDSRKEAEALCAKLRQAGGSCIVVKN